MNNWSVYSEEDGWIKMQMYALSVDDSTQDYYYSTSREEVVRSSDDTAISPEELVDIVQTVNLNLLKTFRLDYYIAQLEAHYTDLNIKGKCSNDKDYREHISRLQIFRTAAKIQFDTFGNTWNGARIVEESINYIITNGFDELDND